MLVILKENVDALGTIGDVVKVANGYARNFLIPRKLAAVADSVNLARVEHQKRTLEKRRLEQTAAARELAEKLTAFSCTISRKVGEHDKLFGSVGSSDIAEVLATAGYKVEKRMLQILHPIKTLGVHTVSVKLTPEVITQVKVWVVKEEEKK